MRIALALLLALFGVVVTSGAAHGQEPDPWVLFADKNYAAAAAIFEARFAEGGRPNDGVNAVVAWRTAGRYAHARALLARVAPLVKPGDKVEAHVRQLEEKLARLTGTAALAGDRPPASAIVKVDGQLPERLGELILLDVGEHTLTVEQELCDTYTWRGVVLPADEISLPVTLRCDQTGTLHVILVASMNDRKRTITIDGKPYDTSGVAMSREQEIETKLAPGLHRIRIENRKRLVADEVVEIVPKRTLSRRFHFPWRAQELPFGVRATSVASVTRLGAMTGLGAGLGMDGYIFALFMDIGAGTMNASTDVNVWFGAELALHLFRRPLWEGRRRGAIVALDFDPLAFRADFVSKPVPELTGEITRTFIHLSFLPVRFSAERAPVQLQLTIYPLTWVYAANNLGGAEDVETGLGAAAIVTLGWHR